MAKYLDYTGLQELVTKVLDAITTDGNLKVSKSASGTSGTGTIDNDGVKIKLQLTDGEYKTAFIKLDSNKITLDVQNSDTDDIESEIDPYGHLIFEITPNDITYSQGGSAPVSIVDKLDFDGIVEEDSNKAVTSGAVYSVMQNLMEVAEGKTRNIVISDATVTGYVNSSFNSTNSTITLTISGSKIKDVENNDVLLSSLKVGDIVSITDTNVPDRWVGSISGGNIVFYPLETKLNIDATPTQNSTNPVSSGGVYTALQDKQDTMTAITTAEVDALF